MNARITSPDAFCRAFDAVYGFYKEQDNSCFHKNLPHNPQSIKDSIANTKLLQWRYPTWARIEDGEYKSLLVCELGYSIKFGHVALSEFIWSSIDGKSGISLLREAENFARNNDVKLLIFSSMISSPYHSKLEKFYTNNQFEKDSTAYLKIL